MRWIACELHTHTFHSDGRQSLDELASGAAALGFDCIALTDHNTMTGLAGSEEVAYRHGIAIIPGMEWTTFHGHMVTLGLDRFVDWRNAAPDNITQGAAAVRKAGGIAGMAHPFRIGSPICTGCFWEYEITDWSTIDYIEVWSGTFPPVKTDNQRAYALWTERLNAGCRIAATSGRDWHAQEDAREPVSVTYLGLEDGPEPVAVRAVRALAAGRVSVTLGPLLTMTAAFHGDPLHVFQLGDSVTSEAHERKPDSVELEVFLDLSVRSRYWTLPAQRCSLVLTGSPGVLAERTLELNPAAQDREQLAWQFTLDRSAASWVRAELWGVAEGVRTILSFTNAIYLSTRGPV